MKAAVIGQLGQAPTYDDFPDPVPQGGETLVALAASALSRTTKSRASGRHYSSPDQVPFVPGIDGVGSSEIGQRVFFLFPRPPYGSLAEKTVVPTKSCVPLPDGISSVNAAAIANPGISSWTALVERAKLKVGETVLINGATGVAGGLAVQVARHLGAKKVIAVGRNSESLERARSRGADVTISLLQPESELDRILAHVLADGIDVVLDYLWGASAERLLIAAARFGRDDVPLRYVEIGSMTGSDISLPSAVLRSSSIMLMGSGTGGIPTDRLLNDVGQLFDTAASSRWEVAVRVMPLESISQAWANEEPGARTVVTMDAATSRP